LSLISRVRLKQRAVKKRGGTCVKSPKGLIFVCIVIFLLSLSFTPGEIYAASTITFTGGELLGKLTDTSITINIVPDVTIEYYYEYGTSSGAYTDDTDPVEATGGEPHEVVITELSSNTRYYYRMLYHAPGDSQEDWVTRDEHSFHTQRAEGEEFIFTITSDSHAQFSTNHQQAMINVNSDQPDFHLDLGSVQARKAYYPTPINDGLYSGNTDPLNLNLYLQDFIKPDAVQPHGGKALTLILV
jgi:hypothetical protein